MFKTSGSSFKSQPYPSITEPLNFDSHSEISGICRFCSISGSIVSFSSFTTFSTSGVSTKTHCILSSSGVQLIEKSRSHFHSKSSAHHCSIIVLLST